ncbi:MAG: hypothetical protein H0T46_24985 [Deltaproteobacteria bacterium]|nr:hypothetical protein [Deltaproteobacteria bacterium]
MTSSTNLTVYGKGATLAGTGRLEVRAGNVDVRDLIVQSTTPNVEGIACLTPVGTFPIPRLTMSDSKNIGSLAVSNCVAKLDRYTHVGGSVRVDEDGTLDADRAFFDGSSATGFALDFFASARRLNVKIVNSVFINYWIQANTTDLSTTNQVKIAFSTLVMAVSASGVGPILCGPNTTYAMVGNFENNVIVAPQGIDAVSGTRCSITNNVLFPMSAPRAGNIVADPRFVNQGAKDFHLMMTSPARDAAMPSAALTTNHDFDNVARPQGTALDIGAFEYKP